MDNKVSVYSCQDMQTAKANHNFTEVYNTVKKKKEIKKKWDLWV